MTQHNHFSSKRISFSRQSGFSIIELMIAGTLGLFLLGGAIQLFLGSNQNYTMQDDLATLQEDGRFAMMFLEKQIQIAGLTEGNNLDPEPAVDMENAGASTDGANDSFTIGYQGVNPTDCNGNSLGTGIFVVNNRFFVDGNGNLMCLGNGSNTPQPLLANVEKFQVLYGVETDSDCPDGVVNSYMSRTDYIAYKAAKGVSEDMINSIRFAILLRSESPILPTAEKKTVQVLDQAFTPAEADKFARRLFQQTVYMPNAVYNILPNLSLQCEQSKY